MGHAPANFVFRRCTAPEYPASVGALLFGDHGSANEAAGGGRARAHGRPPGRAVVRTELDVRARRSGAADLAVFHDDAPPPSGGGNQFLRGLVRERKSRGLAVERNCISRGTPVCLFNSFNFDFRRLRRFHREGVRMVHRVDGPIRTYRGFDDGSDGRIERINAEVAHATVFQSRYSLGSTRPRASTSSHRSSSRTPSIH